LDNQILVTGASGFAGGYMVDYLLTQERNVTGTTFGEAPSGFPSERVPLLPCDLGDLGAVREVIAKVDPIEIYHLAAQAAVGRAWEEPGETFRVNAMGTVNLLEACREKGSSARLLLVSSATVYGPPPADGRLVEGMLLQPNDPYGVSKTAADQAAVLYHNAYGLDILRARAFNHIGPGPADKHAIGNFARQLAELEPSGGGNIRVGNLSARRNFTDVRDVVRAYAFLMEHGETGEAYNVCGDTVLSIEEVLDRLIALSPCEFRKVPDLQRMRPVDTPLLDGDNTKLKRATGWGPEISLEKSLSDLLDYWRERVRESPPSAS
jgi:GDP-4-dehydro-6-deoxy-D-mannose reductase